MVFVLKLEINLLIMNFFLFVDNNGDFMVSFIKCEIRILFFVLFFYCFLIKELIIVIF